MAMRSTFIMVGLRKITVSEDAVLKGWRFQCTKLWWISLQSLFTYLIMHTILPSGPTGSKSLNSLYTIPMCTAVLAHIDSFDSNHAEGETIHNVYELPILVHAVQYLHTAVRFPTKAMFLKGIRNCNYLTWPLLTIYNLNRHFPESEETQKGHM